MHAFSSNDIIVQLRFFQCTFTHLLLIDVGIICEVLKVSFIETIWMPIDTIERECRLHLNTEIFFSSIFTTRKINIFIADAFLFSSFWCPQNCWNRGTMFLISLHLPSSFILFNQSLDNKRRIVWSEAKNRTKKHCRLLCIHLTGPVLVTWVKDKWGEGHWYAS